MSFAIPNTPRPLVLPERLAALRSRLSELQLAEQRETYENNLTEFIKAGWPSIDTAEYQESWAIDSMCDHLEAVTLGHIPRLLLNIPPRCSKTSVCSVAWPAWIWARKTKTFLSGPQVKFLCGSYSAPLSLMNATKARRLLGSPWYQRYWGNRFTLTEDQNSKSQFDNSMGGSRFSTSVGGSLLGIGGDVIIADDPHNSETEKVVETDADRMKVASWWKELSSTRLNDPKQSVIVVVMQRLHHRDLSGVILEQEDDFTHLMIPMRYDERRHCVTVKLPQYTDEEPWEDPRKYTGEELMWPQRFGEVEVDRLERKLGPYMAAGRLQQMPSPKGGGIIKADWWQLWDHQEARRYGFEWTADRKEFPPMELIVGSLDTAFKEKEENDYSALTIWGIWIDRNKNRRAMLMSSWAKRLPLHGRVIAQLPGEAKVQFRERQRAEWGLVELVASTCKKFEVKRLLIEDKARGVDVAQELNRLYARENWGVQLVNPSGDKVSRAHSIVPMFTDNMVWAPNTKWSSDVIAQCENFPKDEHDDLVDTVTQFLNCAREHEWLVRADEMSAAMDEEAAWKPRQENVAEQYGV